MIVIELWDETGRLLLGRADVNPLCGVDCCDECGCCLVCTPGCCPGGCRAVVYQDRLAAWLDEHGLDQDPFRPAPKGRP